MPFCFRILRDSSPTGDSSGGWFVDLLVVCLFVAFEFQKIETEFSIPNLVSVIGESDQRCPLNRRCSKRLTLGRRFYELSFKMKGNMKKK